MNPYLTAIQALENCVKDAMENNIDASTQSEIWRHYQGIKSIAKQLDQDKISLDINTDTITGVNYTVNDLAYDASQPVTFPSAFSEDIITFNTGDSTVTVPEHEDDESEGNGDEGDDDNDDRKYQCRLVGRPWPPLLS